MKKRHTERITFCFSSCPHLFVYVEALADAEFPATLLMSGACSVLALVSTFELSWQSILSSLLSLFACDSLETLHKTSEVDVIRHRSLHLHPHLPLTDTENRTARIRLCLSLSSSKDVSKIKPHYAPLYSSLVISFHNGRFRQQKDKTGEWPTISEFSRSSLATRLDNMTI